MSRSEEFKTGTGEVDIRAAFEQVFGPIPDRRYDSPHRPEYEPEPREPDYDEDYEADRAADRLYDR